MLPGLRIAELSTHNVTNQPQMLENYNLFNADLVLVEGIVGDLM